jgi:hypothetical protein
VQKDVQTKSTDEKSAAKVIQMPHPGWTLVIIGTVVTTIGLLWLWVPSVPWLGKLPGDLRIDGDHVRLFFPLTSCVLLSVVATGLVWLARYLSR